MEAKECNGMVGYKHLPFILNQQPSRKVGSQTFVNVFLVCEIILRAKCGYDNILAEKVGKGGWLIALLRIKCQHHQFFRPIWPVFLHFFVSYTKNIMNDMIGQRRFKLTERMRIRLVYQSCSLARVKEKSSAVNIVD